MGRKLYFEQENKGIIFRTNRCIGDVRIPNYVYDIWMPVVGSDAIGVYGVYCRLEMNGSVKKITQRTLAKACRIGTGKLTRINDLLQECGFIDVDKPTGHKRLMHFTTEITVNDPPQEVSSEIIAKHCTDFEPLTPWLAIAETPNSASDDTKQCLDDAPNSAANIASLGLQPLEFEFTPSSGEKPPPKNEPDLATELFGPFQESDLSKSDDPTYLDRLSDAARGDPVAGAAFIAQTAPKASWTVPEVAGGADPWVRVADAFCCLHGLSLADIRESDRVNWPRKLESIAESARASPEQMIAAIKVLPDTDKAYMINGVYSAPYVKSFETDIVMLISQIAAGQDVRAKGNGNGRYPKQHQQPPAEIPELATGFRDFPEDI